MITVSFFMYVYIVITCMKADHSKDQSPRHFCRRSFACPFLCQRTSGFRCCIIAIPRSCVTSRMSKWWPGCVSSWMAPSSTAGVPSSAKTFFCLRVRPNRSWSPESGLLVIINLGSSPGALRRRRRKCWRAWRRLRVAFRAPILVPCGRGWSKAQNDTPWCRNAKWFFIMTCRKFIEDKPRLNGMIDQYVWKSWKLLLLNTSVCWLPISALYFLH